MNRLVMLLGLLLATATVLAQRAEVRVGPGPYYADVPIEIQVIAEGFEVDPEPVIEADPPAGAELTLVGVSPNVSSSIRIINGQMSRDQSVRYIYRFQLLARAPGPLEVGPFQISQGSTTASARALRFQVQQVATTGDQRFRMILPDGPFWVGQRVPVTLEWWLTEDFAQRLAGRRARVPLFDQVDRFRFEDPPSPDAKNSLTLDTATGLRELPVTVGREEWQGKTYLVVKGQRTLIALKPGEVDLEPASLTVEETVRWSRDFFGKRVPSSVRTLRIRDQPHTMVFRSPPAQGRPPSFAGAVGTGFSLQVSADRSVVQAGDPIRLTLEVRGDAAVETISLPRLTDAGLSADEFKVPEGPVAGIVNEAVKRFEVVVRVNSEQVREIPPIELSWFNPEAGSYESTRSRPIAVSVRAATRVSADDVITATGGNGEAAQAPGPDPAGDSARPGISLGRPAFSLSGAELAIETRLEVLRQDPTPWYARPVMVGAAYLMALAALGAGLVARRRAAQDPGARKRRQDLASDRHAVSRASRVGELAGTLRRMAAASPQALRQELDALVAECDNLTYAPGAGGDTPVDGDLKARALILADNLMKTAT